MNYATDTSGQRLKGQGDFEPPDRERSNSERVNEYFLGRMFVLIDEFEKGIKAAEGGLVGLPEIGFGNYCKDMRSEVKWLREKNEAGEAEEIER